MSELRCQSIKAAVVAGLSISNCEDAHGNHYKRYSVSVGPQAGLFLNETEHRAASQHSVDATFDFGYGLAFTMSTGGNGTGVGAGMGLSLGYSYTHPVNGIAPKSR